MTVNKLPHRTLLLWQIRVAVIDFLILAVLLYFRWSFKWITSLYIIFSLFCLALIFWYLPRYISSYNISLIEGAVVIKSGVIVKSTQIMPHSKMIYTQTFTSPLANKMNITALSLKAARSRIFIPEMLKEDADALLNALSGEIENE